MIKAKQPHAGAHRRKAVRILAVLLSTGTLLTGCKGTTDNPKETEGETPVTADFSKGDSDMFTERDRQTAYEESDCIRIELNGDAASASANTVKISGSVITLTQSATYLISGTLDDGMIIVDAAKTDKLQLVLNGVRIQNSSSAALYIRSAAKVFVTLADGTENTLSCGETFDAIDSSNIDGAVFSKDDLTFNGNGSLSITAPVGHGIVCKNDLVFTGGRIKVTAASHGLQAKDSVRITGDTAIAVQAGKDGIHAENSDDASLGFVYLSGGQLDLTSDGDGISARAYLQITDGSVRVLSGGGSSNAVKKDHSDGGFGFRPGFSNPISDTSDSDTVSTKGLKAENSILITGGTFEIDAADDGIHSNASITLNGGTFTIAAGDDGVHADDTLTVTDGKITITESYEGLEALHVLITGGDITLTAEDDGINAAEKIKTDDAMDNVNAGFDPFGNGNEPPNGNNMQGGNEPPKGNNPQGRPDGDMGMGGGRPQNKPDGNGRGDHGGDPGGMNGSSNGTIVISGGTINIHASGDGIDANGSLTISGGHTVIVGPNQGDTATLDFDTTGVISGGIFIGTGASGMAQTFTSSEQGVLTLRVGNQSAGEEIVLKDQDGNVLITHTPDLPFSFVILSSPDIISGKVYTVSIGNSSQQYTAS